MSTTFGVKIPTEEEEIIVAYRGNGTGMFWRNPLAPYLPDDMKVIPLDNTAQGIKTIGDIRKAVNDKIKMKLSDLRDEIYHSEDVIDGAYNSEDVNFSKYEEINTKYEALLKNMNELVSLLNDVVDSN